MRRTIRSELAELKTDALYRTLQVIGARQESAIKLVGNELINFSSNDYLGLATHPLVCEAAKKAIDEHGVGAGASRLVCGTRPPHVRLEQRLAEFKGAEAALTFSSGYAAALGTLGQICVRPCS